MIQQICISNRKALLRPVFDQPMELVIKAEDLANFEKEIRLLFDKESVLRIKRASSQLIGFNCAKIAGPKSFGLSQ